MWVCFHPRGEGDYILLDWHFSTRAVFRSANLKQKTAVHVFEEENVSLAEFPELCEVGYGTYLLKKRSLFTFSPPCQAQTRYNPPAQPSDLQKKIKRLKEDTVGIGG